MMPVIGSEIRAPKIGCDLFEADRIQFFYELFWRRYARDNASDPGQ